MTHGNGRMRLGCIPEVGPGLAISALLISLDLNKIKLEKIVQENIEIKNLVQGIEYGLGDLEISNEFNFKAQIEKQEGMFKAVQERIDIHIQSMKDIIE